MFSTRKRGIIFMMSSTGKQNSTSITTN
ncbi:hypothetical protein Pint_30631 [Pistacia integerrima]|uniref:Uncharacterized protein n=1 Tax=Pistacia integerrima TaxID=434235 RepID=A0ACC0X0Z6_9ROSI|nr:hypothetical protein Pint_30631 [Pistacia integerrima]